MKNTLKEAKFRMVVYKGKEGYVGICYETGDVKIFSTAEETVRHLYDSALALMYTIKEGKLSLKAINERPSFRYRVIFHVLPVVASFYKSLDFSYFTKPVSPIGAAHA